jgi:hypothetical protein
MERGHNMPLTAGPDLPLNGRPDADAEKAREGFRADLRSAFEKLKEETIRARRRSDAIEIVALFLSIVTSGAIWTLLAHMSKLETPVEVVGACAGTLTTFVLVFQKTYGPHRRLIELKGLMDTCTELSAEVRGLTFHDAEPDFYESWKQFHADLAAAGIDVDGGVSDFAPLP